MLDATGSNPVRRTTLAQKTDVDMTTQKGDTAELAAALKLRKLGYAVSFPFGDHSRYDLVVDDGDSLHRAQVKNAKRYDEKGIIKFRCISGKGSKDRSYTKEDIDCFLAYEPSCDELFWVDVEDAPKTSMTLRFRTTKNGQKRNINEAGRYILCGK